MNLETVLMYCILTHNVLLTTHQGDVKSPSKGDVIAGQFKELVTDQALLLTTPHGLGRVDVTDISDHYADSPLEGLKKNTIVK